MHGIRFCGFGSNKASSCTVLMGAGLHSCALFFYLIEVYLKVSLVNCWTGSCSLSHHTLMRVCISKSVCARNQKPQDINVAATLKKGLLFFSKEEIPHSFTKKCTSFKP